MIQKDKWEEAVDKFLDINEVTNLGDRANWIDDLDELYYIYNLLVEEDE